MDLVFETLQENIVLAKSELDMALDDDMGIASGSTDYVIMTEVERASTIIISGSAHAWGLPSHVSVHELTHSVA